MSVNLAHYLQKYVEPNETGIAVINTILCLCNASKIIAKALCENGLPDNQSVSYTHLTLTTTWLV